MTTKNVTAFLGSARPNGQTAWLLDEVAASFNKNKDDKMAMTIMDLYDYDIKPLSRNFIENKTPAPTEDDMAHLIPVIKESKVIILATPIYWFTVSGMMKNFLDRWYDFSDEKANLNINGKGIAVVTAHANPSVTMSYPVFKMVEGIAEFCNMTYLGGVDTITSAKPGTDEYNTSAINAELLGKRIVEFLKYMN
ncbi:MAG: flavodoxin family protein [Vampirovibrionia bacterium]